MVKKNPPKTPLNKTDKRVWDTVKKSVKPIEHENSKMADLLSEYADTDPKNPTPIKGAPPTNSPFKQTVGDIMGKITNKDPKFTPNVTPSVTPSVTIDRINDLTHGDISNMHQSQGKRFLRGQLPVEATLDLHGMTQDRAHRQLNEFIQHAHMRGLRKVIIITGKGQGILKNQTPRWLNDPILRPFIVSFSYAQPRDGGDGALYVLIRKNR